MKNLQVHTRHQENGVPFVGMRSHVFDKLKVLGKGACGGLVIITEVLLPFSGDHWVPVLLEETWLKLI